MSQPYQTTNEGWNKLRLALAITVSTLKPSAQLKVSEWAEKYRYLSSEASADSGKWHNARTPYLVEPMDCLSPDSGFRDVICMFPSQTGKTEILNNFAGYIIHYDPGPALVLQPNVKPMAEAWSKDRLAPMIRDTPVLKTLVSDSRSRDSGNTIGHKSFPGGHITIAGANSPAGLASRPIRYFLGDEIDRYPESAGSEGDPLGLALKRTVAFWNRKRLRVSSPTYPNVGIDYEYQRSDKRRLFVPCPECGHKQILKWANLKWTLVGDVVTNVFFSCAGCQHEIRNNKRQWMLARGEWVAECPDEGKPAGFWMNQLYSPFVEWRETIEEFLEKKDDASKLQTFINTALAETWEEKGVVPPWEEVAKLKAPYRLGARPKQVQMITCGVDVQKDCIYFSTRGWGYRTESWLLDHGQLFGDTDQDQVWEDLEHFAQGLYGGMPIHRMLVDSGYRTSRVYAFCRQVPNAVPTKGRAEQAKPLSSTKVDVNYAGIIVKKGLTLWSLHTGYFKDWIHARIGRDNPDFHLFESTTDDYCKQIVSESVIQKGKNRVWLQHDPNNHYLDCEVGNIAGAQMLNVHALPPLEGGQVQSRGRRIRSKGI